MKRFLLAAFAAVVLGAPAQAQHGAHSPYAGLERRAVKALSAEQLADLREGRGMSLALAAELNGYPGPLHVLELADRLALSDAQRAQMQALYDAMKREAVAIGARLIAHETELDRQFSARSISPAALAASTEAIGATQGALRHAHLKYHLSTLEVLTPAQIRRYSELRGYAGDPSSGPDGHRKHHP